MEPEVEVAYSELPPAWYDWLEEWAHSTARLLGRFVGRALVAPRYWRRAKADALGREFSAGVREALLEPEEACAAWRGAVV